MKEVTTVTVSDAEAASAAEQTKEGANGAPSGQPEGGELILGKFKTQEDLIAAYRELEKKNTQESQGKATEPEPSTEPKPEETAPTEAEKKAAEKKGIDFDALDAEFRENGALSEETIAALEEAGFPKARIEQHLAGIQALQSQMEQRIAQAVGGQQSLQQALEWGGSNLSQAEADAYEAALQTGNEALITQAVQNLVAKYEAANGRTPRLLNGGNVPSATGVKPFQSDDEIARAMADPLYQQGDKAYHAEVDARLRATYGI